MESPATARLPGGACGGRRRIQLQLGVDGGSSVLDVRPEKARKLSIDDPDPEDHAQIEGEQPSIPTEITASSTSPLSSSRSSSANSFPVTTTAPPTFIPMIHLYPIHGAWMPKHLFLPPGERVVLGRSGDPKYPPAPENGLFSEPGISLKHVEVWCTNGSIRIRDTGSIYGACLNSDMIIDHGGEFELRTRDILRFITGPAGADGSHSEAVHAFVFCEVTEADTEIFHAIHYEWEDTYGEDRRRAVARREGELNHPEFCCDSELPIMPDGHVKLDARVELDAAAQELGWPKEPERPPTKYHVVHQALKTEGQSARVEGKAEVVRCYGDGTLRWTNCSNAAVPTSDPPRCKRCTLVAQMVAMGDPRKAQLSVLRKRKRSAAEDEAHKALAPKLRKGVKNMIPGSYRHPILPTKFPPYFRHDIGAFSSPEHSMEDDESLPSNNRIVSCAGYYKGGTPYAVGCVEDARPDLAYPLRRVVPRSQYAKFDSDAAMAYRDKAANALHCLRSADSCLPACRNPKIGGGVLCLLHTLTYHRLARGRASAEACGDIAERPAKRARMQDVYDALSDPVPPLELARVHSNACEWLAPIPVQYNMFMFGAPSRRARRVNYPPIAAREWMHPHAPFEHLHRARAMILRTEPERKTRDKQILKFSIWRARKHLPLLQQAEWALTDDELSAGKCYELEMAAAAGKLDEFGVKTPQTVKAEWWEQLKMYDGTYLLTRR